jgi:hypothetical protein
MDHDTPPLLYGTFSKLVFAIFPTHKTNNLKIGANQSCLYGALESFNFFFRINLSCVVCALGKPTRQGCQKRIIFEHLNNSRERVYQEIKNFKFFLENSTRLRYKCLIHKADLHF